MLCAIIVGPTVEKARDQLLRAAPLCNLAELRLDLWKNFSIEDLKNLKIQFPHPLIFTARDETVLLKLADLQPDFIDLAHNMPLELFQQIRKQKVKVIASFHDFSKTPDHFNLFHLPADLYKIACMTPSTIDALKLLIRAKESKCPLIVSGIGENGAVTRLLGPIYKSAWTYAPLSEEEATAPGQIPLETFHSPYHLVNASTRVYGLIGDPVVQSIGHIVHNRLMKPHNCLYVKMRVTKEELPAFIPLMKELKFSGLSVTMPLKEAILPYLDHPDESVKAIGACNTLLFDRDALYGFNTDGKGALDAIEEVVEPNGKRLLIIGAGGASRAIAFEAKVRGMEVIVLNRSQLAYFPEYDYDILVNATPANMPIEPEWIKPGRFVMDINIKETALLKVAKERGCTPIPGRRMFFHQAAGQIQIWNYAKMPSNIVWESFSLV